MSVLPRLICRFEVVLIKIPTVFCRYQHLKVYAKVYIESQKTWTENTISKEQKKAGELTLPDIKAYYNATVIRIA